MKKILFLLLVPLSTFALLSINSIEGFSRDSTNTFEYNYRKGMECYDKGEELQKKYLDEGFKSCGIPTDVVEQYGLALPYLERAYTINNKDEKLLKSLMIIYSTWGNIGKGKKRGKEYYAKSEKCRQEYDALVSK